MSDIALGVATLNRTDRLAALLDSVERTPIEKVYVADNGRETPEKEALYGRDFEFDLVVFDLEFDVGLGACRDHVVENWDGEDYLLVPDDDHVLTPDVVRLRDVLADDPSLGGVAGTVMEPDRGRIWQSAKDFTEEGDALVRSAARERKRIEFVGGHPVVEFDFLPYPALYRRECVEDYAWDPQFEIGRAHVDFYLTHWKETDWDFAVCPNVFFEHYPGGDREYIEHRRDDDKYERSARRFREKWGYAEVAMGERYWFDTDQTERSVSARIAETYESEGLRGLVRGASVVARNLASR